MSIITFFLQLLQLHAYNFFSSTIGRFLLALAEGPLGPLVKMVTDGVTREGPTGRLGKIVMNRVLTML